MPTESPTLATSLSTDCRRICLGGRTLNKLRHQLYLPVLAYQVQKEQEVEFEGFPANGPTDVLTMTTRVATDCVVLALEVAQSMSTVRNYIFRYWHIDARADQSGDG